MKRWEGKKSNLDNLKMHIVIFNWRDIKNPLSGGAEVMTHEVSKYLVKKGHTVTQFSSHFRGAKKREILDGIHIMREGDPDLRSGVSSVHYKAFQYYRRKKFGKIDILIDEVHGVPFFTTLYVKEKKIAFVCEKAGDLWNFVIPFPLSFIGRVFESLYPIFYKHTPIITISKSSLEDLESMFPLKNISVVYPGCNFPIIKIIPKKPNVLTLVFIARLSKAKGIEDAIAAVKILKDKGVESKLNIVGRGPKEYVDYLKKYISQSGVSSNITLCGFVTEHEKVKLIDKSHFLIAPSLKEGWGLTVHEAGARGVPTIAYNVSGLKEVVNHKNGVLVENNTPASLADSCIKLFNDKKVYSLLQKGAVEERKKYSWENTNKSFLKIIMGV